MGLFLKQSEQRSELQTRIGAELEERLKKKVEVSAKKPDEVILDNSRTTSGLKIILAILGILLVAFIFWLLRP